MAAKVGRLLSLFLVLVIITSFFGCGDEEPADTDKITFPDSNLEVVIREALDRPKGSISATELEGLTFLYASARNISDLTGLEYCSGLTHLDLASNVITDISPLASLNEITWLSLANNAVSDISPLKSLTGLTVLHLSGNRIADISPLANLTNLNWLHLGVNQVSNISPLANLTRLNWISLETNQVSDLSPLASLDEITHLGLKENQISDLSPISSLDKLTWVSLQKNRVSDISPLASSSNLTWLDLGVNQVSDIETLSLMTGLTYLNLRENEINNLSPIAGCTCIEYLYLQQNDIKDISSLIDLTSLRILNLADNNVREILPLIENSGLGSGDTLDLMNNPLSITSVSAHLPELEARRIDVKYPVQDTAEDAVPPTDLEPVKFADMKLEAHIREVLDKPKGSITSADLASLTFLMAPGRDISDLTGIEYCLNLECIHLQYNNISDLSPLAGLNNLRDLNIFANKVSNLGPISGLTGLRNLNLAYNNVSNLSPLANLTGLRNLNLMYNNIIYLPGGEAFGEAESLSFDSSEYANANYGFSLHYPSEWLEKPEDLLVEGVIWRAGVERMYYIPSIRVIVRDAARYQTWQEAYTPALVVDNKEIDDILERRTNLLDGTAAIEAQVKYHSLDFAYSSLVLALKKDGHWIIVEVYTISDWGEVDEELYSEIAYTLSVTQIEDIGGISGLTNLRELHLTGNNIGDITELAGLEKLEWLYLGGNGIEDIGPLAGLINIEGLYLADNEISDISALVSNEGLDGGEEVNLQGNPLRRRG